jgi:hypothetical protein
MIVSHTGRRLQNPERNQFRAELQLVLYLQMQSGSGLAVRCTVDNYSILLDECLAPSLRCKSKVWYVT